MACNINKYAPVFYHVSVSKYAGSQMRDDSRRGAEVQEG